MATHDISLVIFLPKSYNNFNKIKIFAFCYLYIYWCDNNRQINISRVIKELIISDLLFKMEIICYKSKFKKLKINFDMAVQV